MNIDTLLLFISVLIIVSIIIAKISNNIGVPIMLLFIGVGMMAGSEGPGNIYFDDAELTQNIGIIALVFILFSGGLDTKWKHVKHILKPAISLSTLGVLITTISIGAFVHYIFDIDWLVGLLLGAVVSSTDAAAVFSIISTRNINLKGGIKPLLELESGTNDPMAVFLTISLIELITIKEFSIWSLTIDFVLEMGVGLAAGLLLGKLYVLLINKIRFPIEGFYTVFTLAFAMFIYSLTTSLQGSGFLAVYVGGLMVSNNDIVHKKSIFRFFDGIAWLSQIGMFLTLGLLVYPSELIKGFSVEILIALFLILFARPLGVFTSLAFSSYQWREKLFISLVGLRGAVPIILATFPLLANIKEAGWIFNIVFFIVLTSALLQGWPMPFLARWLGLDAPYVKKIKSPIEFSEYEESNMKLINLKISDRNTAYLKKSIVQLPELKGSLIVTVFRDEKYFVPTGGTILEPNDTIQVLADNEKAEQLERYFSKVNE